MFGGKTHILYLQEGPTVEDRTNDDHETVQKFDLCTRKTEKVLERVDDFIVSANAQKVLYQQFPERDPSHGTQGGEPAHGAWFIKSRSEEHTSELQSRRDLVCRLLLEKKK